jgi:hypothetical protein
LSFARKEDADEREAKAAASWQAAKASLRLWGHGCLFFAVLVALFIVYAAGYVAAEFG